MRVSNGSTPRPVSAGGRGHAPRACRGWRCSRSHPVRWLSFVLKVCFLRHRSSRGDRLASHRSATGQRNGPERVNQTFTLLEHPMPSYGTSPASDDYVTAAVAGSIAYSSPYASGALAETI